MTFRDTPFTHDPLLRGSISPGSTELHSLGEGRINKDPCSTLDLGNRPNAFICFVNV